MERHAVELADLDSSAGAISTPDQEQVIKRNSELLKSM